MLYLHYDEVIKFLISKGQIRKYAKPIRTFN